MVDLVKQNFLKNAKFFTQIKKDLTNILDDNVKISHVGSTALPNMVGKNIVDVLIAIPNHLDIQIVSKKLISAGYFLGKTNSDQYVFFASTNDETKSGDIHIHLVYKNTQQCKDFLALKEYLLSNKNEIKKYADYKQKIVKEGKNSRKDYKKEKSFYIDKLLARARKYYDEKSFKK